MDEDIDRIALLPEEFDELRSTDVDEGLASPVQAVENVYLLYYEQSDDFNFAVAMYVVDDVEETIELEDEDAVSVMAGERGFSCVNCCKICKSKAGLTKRMRLNFANIPTQQSKVVKCPSENYATCTIQLTLLELNRYGTTTKLAKQA